MPHETIATKKIAFCPATRPRSLLPRRDSGCTPSFHGICRCLAISVQDMTERTFSTFPIRITVPWLVPQHSHKSRERLNRLLYQFRKRLFLGYLLIREASSILNAQTLQLVLASPGTVSVFAVGFSVTLQLSKRFG